MNIKQLIELDKMGKLKHERKGLKGIVNRGTFNGAYETCAFYKATAIKGVDFKMMVGDKPKPKHCYW
tara:strand:- start:3 stop:203 length:201 start_codon:yes stop_codon:yes gene_type:complete